MLSTDNYDLEAGKNDSKNQQNFHIFAISTYMHLGGITHGREVLDLVGCCTIGYQIVVFHFTKLDSTKMLLICPLLSLLLSDVKS